MNILKEQRLITNALDKYRAQLDTIPDNEFGVTPKNGGWSYAEVYSHILQATIGASIALERCTHDTSKAVKGKLTFWGKLVLALGKFPIRVKTPDKIAAMMSPAKISREEARNLIVKCRQRVEHVVKLMNDSTSKRRMQHPRMGMLNAGQWLKFIRIHLEHHLKQLKRINKTFPQ